MVRHSELTKTTQHCQSELTKTPVVVFVEWTVTAEVGADWPHQLFSTKVEHWQCNPSDLHQQS